MDRIVGGSEDKAVLVRDVAIEQELHKVEAVAALRMGGQDWHHGPG